MSRSLLASVTGDSAKDLAFCRTLAQQHVLRGEYGAILAPSAALPGGVNLMIYNLRTDHIRELSNGPDRVAITPGYNWLGMPAP